MKYEKKWVLASLCSLCGLTVALGCTSVPADDPECDVDNPCPGNVGCVDGLCIGDPPPLPDCDKDHPCPEGKNCVNGECVEDPPEPECFFDDDCPIKGQRCHDSVCMDIETECETDDDCLLPGYTCSEQGLCEPPPPCKNDLDCGENEKCLYGSCVGIPPACSYESPCPEGQVCNNTTGQCERRSSGLSDDGWGCSCTTVGTSQRAAGVAAFLALLGLAANWLRRRTTF